MVVVDFDCAIILCGEGCSIYNFIDFIQFFNSMISVIMVKVCCITSSVLAIVGACVGLETLHDTVWQS